MSSALRRSHMFRPERLRGWEDYPQHPEKHPMDTNTPALASIGIDIGKEFFHIVGFGSNGKVAFRRKIKRLALVDTFKGLPSCVIRRLARGDRRTFALPGRPATECRLGA